MKMWIADFSVRDKDGEVTEDWLMNIEAENIVEAVEKAQKKVREEHPNDETVVWSVDIMDDDVF